MLSEKQELHNHQPPGSTELRATSVIRVRQDPDHPDAAQLVVQRFMNDASISDFTRERNERDISSEK